MAKKKKLTNDLTISVTGGGSTPYTTLAATAPEEKEEVIQLLSVDFGREDLNTMARKFNEIIVKMNG